MTDKLDNYRAHLVLAKQTMHEAYDRTVLALSGGGLGLSLAFVDKFVVARPLCARWLLLSAWVAWTLSVTVMLASHFFSIRALGKAVEQVDQGTAHVGRIGGRSTKLTEFSNALGAILFVVGAALMVSFVTLNLGR